MSRISTWFERRFAFDFPSDLFPNLVERLSGTPVRLEELLHGVPPGRLVERFGSRWSIQEEAGHLLDLESLWRARVVDFLGRTDTLTPADLSNRKTHEARHNERPLVEITRAFRSAREAWIADLAPVGPDMYGMTALHPRLQTPMRIVDHLFFVAEHDDHHLARIRELKQLPAKGATL